jgi:L-lactate dehydrogenase
MSRIAIVGAGAVGASFAYSLMISGLAEEIVLIDQNKSKAEAEAMDLNHGQSFVKPLRLWAGEFLDCRQAHIVVITAGAKQKPQETRLALVDRNVRILEDIVTRVKASGFNGIFLLVSNPVDVLTYFAWKFSGFDRQKVIGSGTVLDSSRFRQLLAEHCQVAAQSVHAYIIGEHGDSEVPAWSLTNIAGIKLKEFCPICQNHNCDNKEALDEIFRQVTQAAYKIIEAKGATYYAIGLALVSIVQAILRNEHRVMPVSSVLQDYYGIKDVALSVPTIVSSVGAGKILEVPLAPEEITALQNSARIIKETVELVRK